MLNFRSQYLCQWNLMILQNNGKVELMKQTVSCFFLGSVLCNKNNLFCALDLVDFTDEEGYGKYLDLHESYVKYINLKGIPVRIF